MENATKALLIAGGILLSLLIITVLLYMTQNIRTIRQAEQKKIETEQLQQFNQEYEAYNKKLMYGLEVKSLINKMKDNNEKYKSNPDYQMTYSLDNFQEIDLDDENNKTAVFQCTKMEYSNQTGRVKLMSFKKIQ